MKVHTYIVIGTLAMAKETLHELGPTWYIEREGGQGVPVTIEPASQADRIIILKETHAN